jgi:hypothetical protein
VITSRGAPASIKESDIPGKMWPKGIMDPTYSTSEFWKGCHIILSFEPKKGKKIITLGLREIKWPGQDHIE